MKKLGLLVLLHYATCELLPFSSNLSPTNYFENGIPLLGNPFNELFTDTSHTFQFISLYEVLEHEINNASNFIIQIESLNNTYFQFYESSFPDAPNYKVDVINMSIEKCNTGIESCTALSNCSKNAINSLENSDLLNLVYLSYFLGINQELDLTVQYKNSFLRCWVKDNALFANKLVMYYPGNQTVSVLKNNIGIITVDNEIVLLKENFNLINKQILFYVHLCEKCKAQAILQCGEDKRNETISGEAKWKQVEIDGFPKTSKNCNLKFQSLEPNTSSGIFSYALLQDLKIEGANTSIGIGLISFWKVIFVLSLYSLFI